MSDKKTERSKSVADKTYQYSDYYKDDQLSKGMATSHEQVSDTYMEGTVDDQQTKQEKLPRKK
ncbi:YozQ family protein [Oceanobacillus iheyensis]|uniref:YozQ family protein n=1 Tax=Oceanobacillus iheyensis TaxID=182710 RepID=UPI00363BBB61